MIRRPFALIGTSGWSYPHWRGVFYPEDLPQNKWLEYYSQHFRTVEINNSFYVIPKASAFSNWESRVPPDFVFAVKANRFMTHLKKLRGVEAVLDTFMERIKKLKSKLGPILFQLPPSLGFDPERLDQFLSKLPERLRFVVEFRNSSWLNQKTFEILSKHGVGFCIHDLLDVNCPEWVTSDFCYIRFHGFNEKYGGTYPKRVLQRYAKLIKSALDDSIDVYAYFNNDAYGYAIKDALALCDLIDKGGT